MGWVDEEAGGRAGGELEEHPNCTRIDAAHAVQYKGRRERQRESGMVVGRVCDELIRSKCHTPHAPSQSEEVAPPAALADLLAVCCVSAAKLHMECPAEYPVTAAQT